jgi:signal transduction histidine kinase/ActR/RegA family two-component response regulator
MGVSCFFGLMFSSAFLSLKQHLPEHHKILRGWGVIALISSAAALFLPNNISMHISIIISLVSTLSIITAGVMSFMSGLPMVRYFTLSWCFILAGFVTHALAAINILPTYFFTNYIDMGTSLIQILLLCLALGERFNSLRIKSERIANRSSQELVKVNHSLNSALEKLEQSSRLKDQFLSTISHELLTPMNGIEGSLELIKTDHLSKKQQNYIETAKISARDMTELVDTILRFSEIQSGKLKINDKAFELRAAINPLVLVFRQRCLQKGLSFTLHIDKKIPATIKTDSDQLLLVLKQLIDNAIKFTHRGLIQVNIGQGWDEKSKCDMLSLSVIDSGEGINQEKLTSIFEAFEQLDNKNNRSYNGLGIGLAICHQLAVSMGGSLNIESTHHEGTEITFNLPLTCCEMPTTKKLTQPATSFQPKTILVAEDNPVNQLVLKGMLQSLECHIITANNGEEVVEVLRNQPVDLIMMDCQMPLVDGFEATKLIRRSKEAYSNVPIIAVTANALSTDSMRCFEVGMNDYIKKPIKRDIIEHKVKHWLQHGKLAAV